MGRLLIGSTLSVLVWYGSVAWEHERWESGTHGERPGEVVTKLVTVTVTPEPTQRPVETAGPPPATETAQPPTETASATPAPPEVRLVPVYIYCDGTEVLARLFLNDENGARVGEAEAAEAIRVCPPP